MKQWRIWFILAGIWVVIAILNASQGRSGIVIGYNLFSALLFVGMGAAQFYCEKKGKTGKKLLDLISVIVIAIVALSLVLVLLLPK